MAENSKRTTGVGRGNHGNHVRGSDHHRWNDSDLITSHGYVLVRSDSPTGYSYEHNVIMEKLLGRSLLPEELVHHKDGDKRNNDPSNLEVMSKSEHVNLHNIIRKRDSKGRFLSTKGR